MQIARASKITPAATSALLTIAVFGFVGSAAYAIRITKVTTRAIQRGEVQHARLEDASWGAIAPEDAHVRRP